LSRMSGRTTSSVNDIVPPDSLPSLCTALMGIRGVDVEVMFMKDDVHGETYRRKNQVLVARILHSPGQNNTRIHSTFCSWPPLLDESPLEPTDHPFEISDHELFGTDLRRSFTETCNHKPTPHHLSRRDVETP
jgi:hypothetical protein